MGTQLERIDRDMEEALRTYSEAIQDAKIQQAIENFKTENLSRARRGQPMQQKRLTYETLREYLLACNLSGKDFFDINGVESHYPPLTDAGDNILAEMAFLCDRIDSAVLKKLITYTEKLVPALVLNAEMRQAQPTVRALTYLYETVRAAERNDAPKDLRRSYRDKHWATCLSTRSIPEICDFLKVTPHWLMCLDNCCFTCKNPLAEKLVDLLPFVSEESLAGLTKLIRNFAGADAVKEWEVISVC